MKLIADSGSTKTIWILMEHGDLQNTVQTAGLNPYFHSSETVEVTLQTELFPYIKGENISELHFYGAGCSTQNNEMMIRNALQLVCRNADIWIYHDILGAARALFGHSKGIAGILGTGCNSCYYDGQSVFTGVDSLGYIFGDEGAGSYLGKKFMEKYLKKQVPSELKAQFDQHYHYTLEDILNALYNKPYPNRFLASLSYFLAPRQQDSFVHQLVLESFLAFFDTQIKQYTDYRILPVSFIGSIAYYYSDILREAAKEEKIGIGKILQNPVEGLMEYHR
ncbi:MAG: ATPase [Bacteroidales bacterium]|jgi:N-acetylglucosamine kinase-like BadF-type ATPase|nr:ATPase [Bacteroidales bacterium]